MKSNLLTLKPKPIKLSQVEMEWLSGISHPDIERGMVFVCHTCCSRRVEYRVGGKLYCRTCATLGERKARIWAESPVLRRVA